MKTHYHLFSPVRVGPYELPNRLVMAPMTRNRAGYGNVPPCRGLTNHVIEPGINCESAKLSCL